MSGQLGELVIELAANTARLQSDMGKAAKMTQDASTRMSAHFEVVGTAVTRTAGLLAGFAGVASLGSLVKGSIDAADNMSKMSQKVGVAIDQLSGMAYAASLADVSTEQLSKGMGKLAKLMYEAAGDKDGGPAKTFESLGIAVTDAAGKLRGTDDVMMDVAERLSGMKDGAGKTAIAMEVFGKAGADLIPLLNGGKQGIKEAADEAKRFGLVLSEEAGKRAEEFNDNLTRMGAQATGAAMAVVNELAPAVLTFMDALAKGGDLKNSPLMTAIEWMGDLIRNTQREAVTMIATFDKITAWINTGGALGHAFSKEKAAEYARQMGIIREAESAQKADIYAPPAAGPSKTPGGGKGGNEPPRKPGTAGTSAAAGKGGFGWSLEDDLLYKNMLKYREQEGQKQSDMYQMELQDQTKMYQEWSDRYQLELQDQGKAAAELTQQMSDAYQEVLMQQEELYKNSPWEGMKSGIAAYAEEVNNLGRQFDNMAMNTMNNLTNALTEFVMTGKMNFKDFALSVINDLVRIQMQAAVSGIFNMAIGAIGSYFGSAASSSSYNSGGSSDGFGGLLSGARADGGPVSGGQSYLIGERGPEIFTPGASGMITPNSALGGGNMKVTFNLVNQSGHQVKAKEGGTSFDSSGMIKTIILEAMDTDPQFKWAMRGA